MKKSLVAFGLTLGLLSVGGTAAFAGWQSPDDIAYVDTQYGAPAESRYVEGKHQYGSWYVSGEYIKGVLYENCGQSDVQVDTLYGGSNDYYMKGACKYKVKIESGAGYGQIKNYKR